MGLECRRKRLHSMGVKVIDTSPETRIATQIVTANSRKSRPRIPPGTALGMKTAASDSVIEMMVNPISFDPLIAACNGSSPLSRRRTMFPSINDRIVHYEAD